MEFRLAVDGYLRQTGKRFHHARPNRREFAGFPAQTFSLGAIPIWRNTHVVLTSLALSVLVVHTGISFGSGINRWLILDFLLIVLVGFGSALFAAMEGRWSSVGIKSVKRGLVLGHIITFWPLPILLGFHIASVYYF
jgi:nitrite reductase (NADH) large subunit